MSCPRGTVVTGVPQLARVGAEVRQVVIPIPTRICSHSALLTFESRARFDASFTCKWLTISSERARLTRAETVRFGMSSDTISRLSSAGSIGGPPVSSLGCGFELQEEPGSSSSVTAGGYGPVDSIDSLASTLVMLKRTKMHPKAVTENGIHTISRRRSCLDPVKRVALELPAGFESSSGSREPSPVLPLTSGGARRHRQLMSLSDLYHVARCFAVGIASSRDTSIGCCLRDLF